MTLLDFTSKKYNKALEEKLIYVITWLYSNNVKRSVKIYRFICLSQANLFIWIKVGHLWLKPSIR